MKHHKLVSCTPVAGQTTLQVKIDFKTGIADVFVGADGIANAIVTFMSDLVSQEGFTTAFFTKALGGP